MHMRVSTQYTMLLKANNRGIKVKGRQGSLMMTSTAAGTGGKSIDAVYIAAFLPLTLWTPFCCLNSRLKR